MSILSLAEVAVERDVTPTKVRTITTKRRSTTDDDGGGQQKQQMRDTLTSAIPTETLAVYTAVVGVVASVGGADAATGYLPFRWWAYGFFLALTVGAVWFAYGQKAPRVDSAQRRKASLPVLETVTALLAAATWGLVMPGSALSIQLDGNARTIAISTITIVGAAVVAALSSVLTKGAKKP